MRVYRMAFSPRCDVESRIGRHSQDGDGRSRHSLLNCRYFQEEDAPSGGAKIAMM
jgi:hypothetical protein